MWIFWNHNFKSHEFYMFSANKKGHIGVLGHWPQEAPLGVWETVNKRPHPSSRILCQLEALHIAHKVPVGGQLHCSQKVPVGSQLHCSKKVPVGGQCPSWGSVTLLTRCPSLVTRHSLTIAAILWRSKIDGINKVAVIESLLKQCTRCEIWNIDVEF